MDTPACRFRGSCMLTCSYASALGANTLKAQQEPRGPTVRGPKRPRSKPRTSSKPEPPTSWADTLRTQPIHSLCKFLFLLTEQPAHYYKRQELRKRPSPNRKVRERAGKRCVLGTVSRPGRRGDGALCPLQEPLPWGGRAAASTGGWPHQAAGVRASGAKWSPHQQPAAGSPCLHSVPKTPKHLPMTGLPVPHRQTWHPSASVSMSSKASQPQQVLSTHCFPLSGRRPLPIPDRGLSTAGGQSAHSASSDLCADTAPLGVDTERCSHGQRSLWAHAEVASWTYDT